MKTRRHGAMAYLALMVAATLVASCGTRTAANEETSSPTAASGTNQTAEGTASTAATGETPAAPAVPRSERQSVPLRPEIQEVVKLVDSGAGEEVVRAYVGGVNTPYELSLEEIIYLRDIGISDGVIAAMMRRGNELRERQTETATMQTNLVNAVEELREALASHATPTNATGTAEATTPPAPAAAPGTPEAPPVATVSSQTPADAPAPVQQFYSPLSPYGSWYQVPTYGWVWQPTVVAANPVWMPYRHGGRWVWTDWGWYWSSDYSWGWAPFHYGRWCTYPGLGWCWVPDSTWGPSWVSWRYSDAHVGWAPLPPGCGWRSGVGLTWHGSGISVGFDFGLGSSCFTFVSYDRFCHRSLHHHVLDHEHSRAVYNHTTVINNVIHGDNNVIINDGPGYARISSRIRDEVPKARIEQLPASSDRTLRADRLERSHDGPVIYRPASVESAGGQPTPVRAEVRPERFSSRTGISSTPSAVRAGGGIPERPNFTSRTGESAPRAGASGLAPKAVETRGNPGMTSGESSRSNPQVTATPSASRPRTTYGTRDNARMPVTSSTPKAIEARGSAPTRAVETSPGNLSPRRQTMPVPLGDPSRNLPANPRYSLPAPSGTGTPQLPAVETRSTPMTAPSAAPSRGESYGPRSAPTVMTPSPNYQRPTASPSPSVSANPRATYSTPAPVYNAPRATYSVPSMNPTPSPSMAAPRATYSAPAPVMSTPRASVSAPSPAGPSPSSGGASSRGNNNARQNPN